MAQSGLSSGMQKGFHQGVKSGFAMSNLVSGLNGGRVSEIWDKSKMQNPVNLTGIKKPLIFNLADQISTNIGTNITLTDLIGSGTTLLNAQGTSGSPDLVSNGITYDRDYLDFNNGTCSLYPSPALNLAGKSEISMIMVCRIKAISAQQVLYVQSSIIPGGIDVSTIDTNRTLRSIYYGGTPGNLNSSQFDTFLSQEESSGWMILTVKYRLKQPGGPGSEQEMYVNGRLQKKFFSSNFAIQDTIYTSGQALVVGNTTNAAGSRGTGIQFGAFLMTDYWLNESEQLRLENYFRWYYGNSF
jgi:hypothetical protein